jgi:hypothetical protein
MKRSILMIILLGGLVFSGFSQRDWQQGYVVSNNGDTIYGLIDYRDSRSNSFICRFRADQKADEVLYTPADINSYRLLPNGKYFVSRQIEEPVKEQVFLEFMLKGPLNLYHYKNMEGSRYFVEKESTLYELKNTRETVEIKNNNNQVSVMQRDKKEFIGILYMLMQDANLRSQINKSELTPKSLISISEKYQQQVCPDEECIIYEMNPFPLKFNWGVYGGLFYNNLLFGGNITSDYRLGEQLGLRLEIENLIIWSEKVTIILDAGIQRYSHYQLSPTSYVFKQLTYNNEDYYLSKYLDNTLNVDMRTIVLNLPISVRYNFKTKYNAPYIGIGILNKIVLHQNDNFYYSWFNNRYDRSIPTYNWGFVGTLGTKIPLKPGHNVFAEICYETSASPDIAPIYRFTNKLISFNLGYSIN